MGKEQEVLDRGDVVDPEMMEEDEFQSSLEDDEDEELEEEEEEDLDDDNEESEDEDEESGSDEDEDADDESDEDDASDDDGDDDESVGDDEEDGEEGGSRIPRSRLNEVIAQRDAERLAREREEERVDRLEAMVEKLIEGSVAPAAKEDEVEPYDFDKSEADFINLVLEGETDKAVALRKEINSEREALIEKRIDAVKATTAQEVTSKTKFDTVIEAVEAKYSFLDADSEDYNEEAVGSVNALMYGYMNEKGMDSVEALQAAVSKLAPMYEEEKGGDQDEPAAKKKPRRKASPKADRKRNAKAAKAQPSKAPGRKGESVDLDTIDISKMSEKAFDKLTEREKRVLRGD